MKYLLVVLVSTIFFGTGMACICYECLSSDDPRCNDPFQRSGRDLYLFSEPCVCGKLILQTLTRTITVRGAVLTNETFFDIPSMRVAKATDRAVSFTAHYCDGRGCNGANSTTALFALIAMTTLILFSYQQLRNSASGAA